MNDNLHWAIFLVMANTIALIVTLRLWGGI